MGHQSSTLKDTIRALVNYSGAFKLGFVLKFVDAHIKDIVADALFSEYLSAGTRETYVCKVGFANLFLKNQELLALLKISITEDGTGRA